MKFLDEGFQKLKHTQDTYTDVTVYLTVHICS